MLCYMYFGEFLFYLISRLHFFLWARLFASVPRANHPMSLPAQRLTHLVSHYICVVAGASLGACPVHRPGAEGESDGIILNGQGCACQWHPDKFVKIPYIGAIPARRDLAVRKQRYPLS